MIIVSYVAQIVNNPPSNSQFANCKLTCPVVNVISSGITPLHPTAIEDNWKLFPFFNT